MILKTLKAALGARALTDCHVFTNRRDLMELAEAAHLSARFLKLGSGEEAPTPFPPGAREALGTLDFMDADFFVLNFRNPLVQSQWIDQAAAQFYRSGRPVLFSIRTPMDHPCQLKAYYRMLDMGLIHLFETEAQTGTYLHRLARNSLLRLFQEQHQDTMVYLTRPFYFDWEKRGVSGSDTATLYAPLSNGVHIQYLPFEQHLEHRVAPPCLYIRENRHGARVLFGMKAFWATPVARKEWSLAGASVPRASRPSVLLHRDTKDLTSCRVHFTGQLPSSLLFRLRSVAKFGIEVRETLEIRESALFNPIPGLLRDENIAFVYSLLQTVEDDTSDLEEPFCPEPALWTVDVSSGKTINLVSGNEINGRQDFPEVFEPEGSFVILKKNATQHFEQLVAEGCAEGFVMGRNESLQVHSHLDMLRYLAILRARTESLESAECYKSVKTDRTR